jgi:hypothetical protein
MQARNYGELNVFIFVDMLSTPKIRSFTLKLIIRDTFSETTSIRARTDIRLWHKHSKAKTFGGITIMSFTIDYVKNKNRIIVTSDGMEVEDAFAYAEQFPKILKKTKRGFTGMTVITGGLVFKQEVMAILAPTGEDAVKAGMSTKHKWVYVAPTAFYKTQMNRMFKDIANLYELIEEAEAYLDSAGN